MLKRPLFLMAVIFTMTVSVLYRLFPGIFIPEFHIKEKEKILLTGQVAGYEIRDDSVQIFLKHSFVLPSGQMQKNTPVNIGKALLILSSEDFHQHGVKIGNHIKALGFYRPFRKARNYGNFDEEEYYYSLGIFLRADISQIRITDPGTDVFRQILADFRQSMTDSIYRNISDPEAAGIMTAICTGDRSGLSDEMKSLYQRSGIAHILAVSGLHISLIGLGIYRLLRKRINLFASTGISLILVTGFCILTGESVSGLRAGLMFGIQMAAVVLGKSYDLLSSACAALLLLLGFHPLYILHSGFQMSFAAILSIGLIYKPAEKYLICKPDPLCSGLLMRPDNNIKVRFARALVLSISITLGTLPVIASVYYEVPLYSILLNILIIPFMSITLGCGLFSAVTGMFSLLMGRFFAGAGVYIVYFIELTCALFQKMPYYLIVTGIPASGRIALYYGLLVFSGYLMDRRSCSADKKRPVRAVLLMVVLILLLFIRIPDQELEISMIDVGQGECILVKSPSGKVFLIDSGSTSIKSAAKYCVSSAVKYKGFSVIDYAIVTHPDTDHMSAVLEILENETVLNLHIQHILTPCIPDNENYQILASLAQKQDIPVTDLYTGLELWDGHIIFQCLYPDKNFRSADSNEYSAVLQLSYGEFSALFTGDLQEAGENLLLQNGRLSPFGYDLLKVAHHGSASSTSERFLRAVSPKLAVISAGVSNSYGHPHKETLERLKKAGTCIYCTADCGEIILSADRTGSVKFKTKL